MKAVHARSQQLRISTGMNEYIQYVYIVRVRSLDCQVGAHDRQFVTSLERERHIVERTAISWSHVTTGTVLDPCGQWTSVFWENIVVPAAIYYDGASNPTCLDLTYLPNESDSTLKSGASEC